MPSAVKWLRSCASKPSRRSSSPQRVRYGNDRFLTPQYELLTARARGQDALGILMLRGIVSAPTTSCFDILAMTVHYSVQML